MSIKNGDVYTLLTVQNIFLKLITFFQKTIDKSHFIVYNIKCSRQRCQGEPRRPSSCNKTKVFYMRKWRNWQTRTFEGRVVYTVRVQVPFSAPPAVPAPNHRVSSLLFFIHLTTVKSVMNTRTKKTGGAFPVGLFAMNILRRTRFDACIEWLCTPIPVFNLSLGAKQGSQSSLRVAISVDLLLREHSAPSRIYFIFL